MSGTPLGYGLALLLLVMMLVYMFIRLKILKKAVDDKTYKARPVVSSLELIVFLLIYMSISYLVFGLEHGISAVIVTALITFILSFFIINDTTFRAIGGYILIITFFVYIVFYTSAVFLLEQG